MAKSTERPEGVRATNTKRTTSTMSPTVRQVFEFFASNANKTALHSADYQAFYVCPSLPKGQLDIGTTGS